MPHLTALIHKDNDRSNVFKKLKINVLGLDDKERQKNYVKVWEKNPTVHPSRPAWPSFACGSNESEEYTCAGKFKWRFEGNQRPPPNKWNAGFETGWIFTDDKYFSWIKAVEKVCDLKNYRHLGSEDDSASGAWALKRAKTLWNAIDKENIPKRMKLIDNVAVDVRVVLGCQGGVVDDVLWMRRQRLF